MFVQKKTSHSAHSNEPHRVLYISVEYHHGCSYIVECNFSRFCVILFPRINAHEEDRHYNNRSYSSVASSLLSPNLYACEARAAK